MIKGIIYTWYWKMCDGDLSRLCFIAVFFLFLACLTPYTQLLLIILYKYGLDTIPYFNITLDIFDIQILPTIVICIYYLIGNKYKKITDNHEKYNKKKYQTALYIYAIATLGIGNAIFICVCFMCW